MEKIIYSTLKIRILSADKKNYYLFDLKSLHNNSPYKYKFSLNKIKPLNHPYTTFLELNFLSNLIFIKHLNLIIKINLNIN
jgi:hypothetical protein